MPQGVPFLFLNTVHSKEVKRLRNEIKKDSNPEIAWDSTAYHT